VLRCVFVSLCLSLSDLLFCFTYSARSFGSSRPSSRQLPHAAVVLDVGGAALVLPARLVLTLDLFLSNTFFFLFSPLEPSGQYFFLHSGRFSTSFFLAFFSISPDQNFLTAAFFE